MLFTSKDVVLCLGLAARIHGTNMGVIRCCIKLRKHTNPEIHPHINLVREAHKIGKKPLAVARTTVDEYLAIEALEKSKKSTEGVSNVQ